MKSQGSSTRRSEFQASRFNMICTFTTFIEKIPSGTKPVALPGPSHPEDCISFSRNKAEKSPVEAKCWSGLASSTEAISILLSQKDRTSSVSTGKEVSL